MERRGRTVKRQVTEESRKGKGKAKKSKREDSTRKGNDTKGKEKKIVRRQESAREVRDDSSGSSDAIPPSPPSKKGKQLRVKMMFNTKKRKQHVISSDSEVENPFVDSDDLFNSDFEGDVDRFAPTQPQSTSTPNPSPSRSPRQALSEKKRKCSPLPSTSRNKNVSKPSTSKSRSTSPMPSTSRAKDFSPKPSTSKIRRTSPMPSTSRAKDFSPKPSTSKSRSTSPMPSTSRAKDFSPKPSTSKIRRTSPKKRERKCHKCLYCGKKVQNIWRHNKNVHKITETEKPKNIVKSDKGYIVRVCPFTNCQSVVDRMNDHLHRKHGVDRGSTRMKNLLKKAAPVTEFSDESRKRKRQNTVKKEKETVVKTEITIKKEIETIVISDDSDDQIEDEIVDRAESYQDVSESQKESIADEGEEYPTYESGHDESSESFEDSLSSISEYGPEDEEESSSNSDSNKEENFFENKEIALFIKYIQRPPELKPRKDALQHGMQAFKVWGTISENRRLYEICNTDKLNDWLQQFLVQHAPGTARSYLSSLSLFVSFLIKERLLRKDISRSLRFKEDIKLLSKSIRKRAQVRKTRLEVDELETMLTPDDFGKFLQSDVAQRAKAMLTGPVPTQISEKDFNQVRNFLLFSLFHTNAQRPGAIKNISTQAITRASQSDEGAVVLIADHKTAAQGPVNLGINPELFNMLRKYLQWINSIPVVKQTLTPTTPIFITFPSKDSFAPMSSNTIHKAVQSLWNKGPVDKPISATRIRKATATFVRQAQPESRLDLAKHMTHRAETADRYYCLINQRDNALKVSSLISSIMSGQGMLPKQVQDSIHRPRAKIIELNDNETEGPSAEIPESIDHEETVETTVEENNEDRDVEEFQKGDDSWVEDYREVLDDITVKGDETPSQEKLAMKNVGSQRETKGNVSQGSSGTACHGRRSFEPEQAATLIELCRPNIEENRITLASVAETLAKDQKGRELLDALKVKLGDAYMKKIVDRVRCEYRKRIKNQTSA